LLQGGGDRLHVTLLTALEQEARHFLDRQRHAASALIDPLDHVLGECVAGRDFTDHTFDAGTIRSTLDCENFMFISEKKDKRLSTG
jgi:hypothetical protein